MGCGLAPPPSPPPEAESQAGDSQSLKARGNLNHRDGILHQTVSSLPVTNQVFLGSWTVDIHQERCSQRSAPQRRHTAHPGNQSSGTREVIRGTAQLGECTLQAPGHLSCSDLGRAQNADPTKSVPLWSMQEPEPE